MVVFPLRFHKHPSKTKLNQIWHHELALDARLARLLRQSKRRLARLSNSRRCLEFVKSTRMPYNGGVLESWAKRHGGYCFDSSTLFCLPNGAKRSPDASWIAPERWQQLSKGDREGYPPICPDFVVELRSKTDRLHDLQDKMNEYVNNGARLGWLIDPIYRDVYIYKPNIDVVCLQNCRQVSDDAILPGFVLDLTVLWPDSK